MPSLLAPDVRLGHFGATCRGPKTGGVTHISSSAAGGSGPYRDRDAGWRGRIRTFDLLIQSQTPESGLASHQVSVENGDLCPIPG